MEKNVKKNMSLDRIAQALIAYRKAKQTVKDTRVELVKLCVEVGIPHEDADKMSVETFLDGYLVANGQIQSHRTSGNQ